jgi:ribulose-phosphate 3-epimerase
MLEGDLPDPGAQRGIARVPLRVLDLLGHSTRVPRLRAPSPVVSSPTPGVRSSDDVSWRHWIRTVEIEPCLNAGDLTILDRQVEALLRTGCRVFHLNVDGTGPMPIGSVVVEAIGPLLRRYDGFLDVHLSGEDAATFFAAVASAGGSSVTFPFESGDVAATIGAAREQGLQVGLAFSPGAEPEEVAASAAGADLVLCLALDSGSDEEELPSSTFGRIRRLVRALPEGIRVQVEGGVGQDNLRDLYEAGAKVFVVGDPIYEREDLPRAYRRLVQALA